MADRRTPFVNTAERDTLLAFLDYLRESVAIKASGLPDADLRRPMVPSGTSLLGLVRHLTMVEVAWFQRVFAGLDTPVPPELADADTAESVVAEYRAACGRSNELVRQVDDLDTLSARKWLAPEPMSLRWVLVHMVEETGRHAGHADIVRELLDGSTGR